MSIGLNIKKRRKELNMTQQQLANKMGFKNKSAISHYEKDLRKPTVETIKKFSAALNCTVQSLIEEEYKNANTTIIPSKSLNESSTHQNTRNAFIDAFWKLYTKKDIDKIKVQEICDLAGYHRNSFYRYFKDTYDILKTIENKIIDSILSNIDKDFILSDNKKYINSHTKIWETYGSYVKVFAQKNTTFTLKYVKKMTDYFNNNFFFSPNREFNDFMMVYQISGSIAAIMYYYKLPSTQISLEEFLQFLFSYKENTTYHLHIKEK